ncbi:hypothetical protein ACIRL2_26625 [Embleya sp. NPDC127516]|uniref:hypothetical protein n=1 Tax=Embleya sp. NPDC127516 TaxID=3363990 RepID=UPI00382D6BBD
MSRPLFTPAGRLVTCLLPIAVRQGTPVTEDDHAQSLAEELGHALQGYMSVLGEIAMARSLDNGVHGPTAYFEETRRRSRRLLSVVHQELAKQVGAAAERAAGVEVASGRPASVVDILRFLPDHVSTVPDRADVPTLESDPPAVVLADQLARGARGIADQVPMDDAGAHPMAWQLLEVAVGAARRPEHAKDVRPLRYAIEMYVEAECMSRDPSWRVRERASEPQLAAETWVARWMIEATAEFLDKTTEVFVARRDDYLPARAEGVAGGVARMYAQRGQGQSVAQSGELPDRTAGGRPVPVVGARAKTGARHADGAPVAGRVSNAPAEVNRVEPGAPAPGAKSATFSSPTPAHHVAAIGMRAVDKNLSAAPPPAIGPGSSDAAVNTTRETRIPTRAQTARMTR